MFNETAPAENTDETPETAITIDQIANVATAIFAAYTAAKVYGSVRRTIRRRRDEKVQEATAEFVAENL